MQRLNFVREVIDWYRCNEVREFSPVAAAERERLWTLFGEMHGAKELDKCCAADLLHFIVAQKDCKSNHTRKRIRATVCRPFNEAARLGLIIRNPFQGVKIARGNRGRDWTTDELQAALRASSPHFRRLMIFLRFSGCRPGEARLLTWPNLISQLGVCLLQDHKTSHSTGEPRRIYLNSVTARLLTWLSKSRTRSEHVFLNSHGQPWTIGSIVRYMRDVRKRASLPRGIRAHGLRHTFATHALMNDVDITTLAELLGHATTRTTEIYQHLVHRRDWLSKAANRAVGRNSAD